MESAGKGGRVREMESSRRVEMSAMLSGSLSKSNLEVLGVLRLSRDRELCLECGTFLAIGLGLYGCSCDM